MQSSTKKILEDIDVLVPLISYLGANPYWWARSARSLADELSLSEERVRNAFESHPMIFKKVRKKDPIQDDCFALQMRYAQRIDGNLDELGSVSSLPVLSEVEVISLVDFLLRIASLETTMRSTRRASIVAAVASVISATAAIVVAILN